MIVARQDRAVFRRESPGHLAAPAIAKPIVREAHALDEWNAIVADSFCGTVVDAESRRFGGDLCHCQINDLKLIRIRAQPSKVQRWLREGPGRAAGSILLHLQVSGIGVNEQSGHHTILSAGEGAICDPDHSYSIDLPTDYDRFIVELPLRKIVSQAADFDVQRLAGRQIDKRRSGLLIAFLEAAWSQRECLEEDADWRECVSRTSFDLALGAIGLLDRVRTDGAATGLRRSVIEHIQINLTDPDLRTSTIARTLRVSPRAVQAVFERMATTTSSYILEKRMALAAQRLLADRDGKNITDHAMDCGFSDSSYFARCFHQSFGVSPRIYRRQRGLIGRRSTAE